jgi:hypothetical protein
MPKEGNNFTITLFTPLFTPSQAQLRAKAKGKRQKAKGKGTALKGQRPYPEKEKAAPVHSFCNTRRNCPYTVPLPSAALR